MEYPVVSENTRPVRMSALKRLPQPKSLFKLLRADEKHLIENHKDELKPEQSRSPDTVPLDESMDSGEEFPSPIPALPEEVTVVSDDGDDIAPVTTISIALMIELLKKRNKRLQGVEAETRQFQLQLQSTQELVDQLTRDLNTSRRQVGVLIKQNTMLMNEMKNVTDKDNVSIETHKMMKVELIALKACMCAATLFILLGGRVELVAVMAVGWLAVDLAG